jgi:hypothetical protein
MNTKVILLIELSFIISWTLLTQASYGLVLSDGNIVLIKETVFSNPPQKSSNTKIGTLDFLTKYNGKYPFDVKLLNNSTIKKRLQQLLGVQQYNYIVEIMEVETPMEVKDGLFYAEGMQAHSGGDPSAVIMADIQKDILFVGIYKDGKPIYFSEGNAELPMKLRNWANSMKSNN